MAYEYEFTIDKKRFDRRVLTELQHKIRVPFKSYTITEFNLNQEDSSFTFKRTVQKVISGRRMVMPDNKLYKGRYIKQDHSEETYKIIITFND